MKKSFMIFGLIICLLIALFFTGFLFTGNVVDEEVEFAALTGNSYLNTEVFFQSSTINLNEIVLFSEEVVAQPSPVSQSPAPIVTPAPIVKPKPAVPTGPKKKFAKIGAEKYVGSTSGMSRLSIALDSKKQSHIVANIHDSSGIYVYHEKSGKWSEKIVAKPQKGGTYDASRIYMPHIEIDSKDRAWISAKFGAKEWGKKLGQGLWIIPNVATNPSSPVFRWVSSSETHKGNGNIGLDSNKPDEGIMMATEGRWAKFRFSNGKIEKIGSGQINAGRSGEKIRFEISPKKNKEGVWHTVMNGFSEQSSSYQNSVRAASGASPVVWASCNSYKNQGSDFSHPSIGIDLKNSQAAYIASGFSNDVFVNIWDGNKMVFSTNSLLVVDRSTSLNGNGANRYAPQWASAKGGGTFICWTGGGNKIRLRYIDLKGSMGAVKEIGSGTNCAITTDDDGDIYMSYVNGGVRFRKITTNY